MQHWWQHVDIPSKSTPEREVLVRAGRSEDLAALTEIYNHYVIHTPITFDTSPVTIEGRAEWMSHYAETGPHRLLVAVAGGVVAVAGGVVAGYATSSRFRDRQAYATSIETTVYCRAGYTGQGIGSRLYAALFDALRGEDIHRAYAGITMPNDASEALHRRFGFTDLGPYHEVGRKFGVYWDVLWLEKALA
jgi:phosphinothricin acetyltransferase